MFHLAVALSFAVTFAVGLGAFGGVAASATGSCQRTHLAAHLVDGTNTASTLAVLVAFRNTGTQTCILAGHPALRFVDKRGHSLANVVRLTGNSRVTVVGVGDYAHVLLEFATRHGGAPSATCPAVAAVWATPRRINSPFKLSTAALPLDFSLCTTVVVHESAVAAGEGPVHHIGA
ncbi:MAG TPA: DUF4232 domain-containing protein [Solirubrobacteraceae bacterium]